MRISFSLTFILFFASYTLADDSSSATGTMPSGQPPTAMGSAGGSAPGGGGGNGNSATSMFLTGSYTVSNETVTNSTITVAATSSNTSVILITNSGQLTLSDAFISKSGNTTSEDDSNFYGLNAAVVAQNGSSLTISNSYISSNSDGSNAIYSTGTGTTIYAYNVTLNTTMNSSRGLDATQMGYIYAKNATITTYGDHCGAFANDRGTGIVVVDGATVNTYGSGSPVVYSTGNITASDVIGTAHGSSAIVVEGANNVTLTNCNVSGEGNQVQPYGVMLYQSTSGDAQDGTAILNMTGGSLNYTGNSGPLFYITNTVSEAYLRNVTMNFSTGSLIEASDDQWGSSGSNGGKLTFVAFNQVLSGNISCGNISSISISLNQSSIITGAINSNNNASYIYFTLDTSSTWNVTGTSYISSIAADDTSFSNIYGNGHNVYYLSSNNTWLGGKTYSLQNGGNLIAYSANASTSTSSGTISSATSVSSIYSLFSSLLFLSIIFNVY
ncbi:hypothetical protein K450DRAFT_299330 [Umbelopsis ramanniana AG]|uniref:Uncharacterized protein n=1 Tax=Umbelopsis ramanniana AG TaxID=1314678 RepID=A0AAD5EE21_UMBRA|nr:uncharacterized protein K450DRAFT_299330 [Umbelopsis ramanniana AG]KAI8580570.1 hypothetical protein K450DRAFT_299330 [Umbelopsis ramanniana AG]